MDRKHAARGKSICFIVNRAKMPEPIEMPFVTWSLVSQGKCGAPAFRHKTDRQTDGRKTYALRGNALALP